LGTYGPKGKEKEKEMTAFAIPLGHGVNAIVDEEDHLPALMFATWCKDAHNYAVCKKKNKIVFLHKWIANRMGLKGEIDHKSRNSLDCRRENLREATRSQNQSNKERLSKSGFRGVYKNHDRWMAQIMYSYEKIHLGTYDTKEAAAKAYDCKAKELFGDFAILNFPT
jgi:AP2 domain/HNH endonuclease